MIGAVYRDAGNAGFRHIRYCRGASGHSIAAVEKADGSSPGIATADSLFAPASAEGAWPDSYFGGRSAVYAVELFGRALDNIAFLEGYIARGPNAGTLLKAAAPYLPGREQAETKKVFAGPYPEPVEPKEIQ